MLYGYIEHKSLDNRTKYNMVKEKIIEFCDVKIQVARRYQINPFSRMTMRSIEQIAFAAENDLVFLKELVNFCEPYTHDTDLYLRDTRYFIKVVLNLILQYYSNKTVSTLTNEYKGELIAFLENYNSSFFPSGKMNEKCLNKIKNIIICLEQTGKKKMQILELKQKELEKSYYNIALFLFGFFDENSSLYTLNKDVISIMLPYLHTDISNHQEYGALSKNLFTIFSQSNQLERKKILQHIPIIWNKNQKPNTYSTSAVSAWRIAQP